MFLINWMYTSNKHENENEIQVSYSDMKKRDELHRQIRNSKIKLRKTFVVIQYNNYIRRDLAVKKNNYNFVDEYNYYVRGYDDYKNNV